MSWNRLVTILSIFSLAFSAAPAVRGEGPAPGRRGFKPVLGRKGFGAPPVGGTPSGDLIGRAINGDSATQRAMARMYHLGRPEVQEDLKLSDEQKQKIEPIVEQARADRENARPPRGQGVHLFEQQKRTAVWEEKAKASWAEISNILTTEQAQRLDQIVIQLGGVRILWNENEEVANTLKLTDEQRQELTGIRGELGTKMDALGRDNPDKRRELEKELVDKCMAILTDEQRAEFAEMQGEKLKLLPPGSGQGPGKPQPK